MSRKLINLHKMWGNAGYNVSVRYERTIDNENVELGLTIVKKAGGGNRVSFNNEWDTLKDLAQRQGFYILPVNQNYGWVMLISHNLVHQVGDQILSVRRSYLSNYWFVQEVSETEAFKKELFELNMRVKKIKCYVGAMVSDMSGRLHEDKTWKLLDEFGRDFISLTLKMSASGLLSQEEIKRQLALASFYGRVS